METTTADGSDHPEERLRERYLDALLRGDRRSAGAVVSDGLEAGLDTPTLFLRVLVPALRTVGERWHRGELSVAEEHWATEVTLDEMARVRRARPPRRKLGVDAVVAVVEGETHVLAARVVAALLEWRGWIVDYLGGSMPAEELRSFVERRSPDLVALSVTLPERLLAARETVALLRTLDPRPLLLVGGAACRGPEDDLARVEADVVDDGALRGISRIETLLGAREQPVDAAAYLASVGKRIREHRNRLGLTQGEVAQRASLTRPYLSAVERGRQNITLEALLRLATALEISIADLLREVG